MLFFVPTPIGNLLDISLHALMVFDKAQVILCEDTRVTKKLFTLLLRNEFIRNNYANLHLKEKRFISFHSHNQDEFLKNINDDFFTQDIAFCTDAGMPNISDPGASLLRYARKHNIEYEVLLGGCAFSHAFVCSGLEGAFYFCGFLAHKQHDRQKQLKSLLEYHSTTHIVLYESPKRLKESLHDIALIMPDSTLFIYKELTKFYETEIVGNTKEILDKLPDNIKGEYCIIIQKDSKSFLESNTQQILRLNKNDILSLDMHPKQKAKLLAQISTKSIKEWYTLLTTKR